MYRYISTCSRCWNATRATAGRLDGGGGWPNCGPNRLGRSVYGPYPPFHCIGVTVPV